MDTACAGGRDAELYGHQKRLCLRTEEHRKEQGLRYWPVVLEQQDGMSGDADSVFKASAAAVADREGGDAQVVSR